jgi:hypothetical protein
VDTVTANAGADVTIEAGESIKLTADGGDTYQWSNGEKSKSILVSPNATNTYEVKVQRNGCVAYDKVTVKVKPLANSKITAFAGNDVTACYGENVILTASGGRSYKWNTGEITQSISVSPKTTTTYTVEVSNGQSSDFDDVIVHVNHIKADAGPNKTIIEGQNITLTAQGGDRYLWSTGETSETITVSPIETSIYSVTAYKDGCEDSDKVQVTVNKRNNEVNLPPDAYAGEDITICIGESVLLKGSGGNTYLWSTGDSNESVKVSPKRTTTYTLEASRAGQIDTDTIVVYVEECDDSGFDENVLTLDMTVYPNPSHGLVNMNITGASSDLELVLFDINGRALHSESLQSRFQSINQQIDLSRLPKGLYFIRISNSDQSLVSKILLV